ncbi:ribonuclease BN [Bacillus subtilis]|nr:ribonuclease BN [Bacillus subtilis] [Bacillus stercoris]
MKYEKTGLFGIILVIIALLVSMYFMFNTKALIPAGYDLAIHGIVISRTLMIAFTLYLVSKLGYFLLNKKISF